MMAPWDDEPTVAKIMAVMRGVTRPTRACHTRVTPGAQHRRS